MLESPIYQKLDLRPASQIFDIYKQVNNNQQINSLPHQDSHLQEESLSQASRAVWQVERRFKTSSSLWLVPPTDSQLFTGDPHICVLDSRCIARQILTHYYE